MGRSRSSSRNCTSRKHERERSRSSDRSGDDIIGATKRYQKKCSSLADLIAKKAYKLAKRADRKRARELTYSRWDSTAFVKVDSPPPQELYKLTEILSPAEQKDIACPTCGQLFKSAALFEYHAVLVHEVDVHKDDYNQRNADGFLFKVFNKDNSTQLDQSCLPNVDDENDLPCDDNDSAAGSNSVVEGYKPTVYVLSLPRSSTTPDCVESVPSITPTQDPGTPQLSPQMAETESASDVSGPVKNDRVIQKIQFKVREHRKEYKLSL